MSDNFASHLQTITDEELVASVVGDGSEAASRELYRRHRKRVYTWCFNISHDREESVDLTQEVFIRLFRGLAGFDGRSRFTTWLYTITRNHCLSVATSRKEKWHRTWSSLEDTEVPDEKGIRNLYQADIADELARTLETAAGLMKPQELEAFVLHYRDGLRVKEISRRMGCTNQTGARTLIQNARRKFNCWLDRKGGRHDLG